MQDSSCFRLPEDFDLQQPLLLEASWDVTDTGGKEVTIWSKGPFLLAGPLLSDPIQDKLEAISLTSVERLCEFLGTRQATQVDFCPCSLVN